MASGIELATAYVSVVGETKQLSKDIERAFDGADKTAGKAGRSMGAKLTDEFGRAAKPGRVLDKFQSETERSGRQAAGAVGRSMGVSLTDAFASTARPGRALDRFRSEGLGHGRSIGTSIGGSMGSAIATSLGAVLRGGAIGAAVGVAAAGAAIGVGTLKAALTKGFERLKNIDDAKFKLLALGNTAADVDTIMKSALASVKGTAFSMDEAATAAASAVAAGIQPGQDLTRYLKDVADAAAVAGTSFTDMGSIFNKIQTSNKAYTDDLNQLADRGLPIFQWLRNEYGVTADELTKMVERGDVDAAHFQHAIETNINGAALKMGESFSGSVANAEAALGRLGAALLAPAFGQGAGGIGSITTALDSLTAWVDAHQDSVIGFWAALGRGAISAADQVLEVAETIAWGLGDLLNVIGDFHGAVTRSNAAVKRLMGQTDLADKLDAEADAAFGWGDGFDSAATKIRGLRENLNEASDSVTAWEEKTKAAAEATRAAAPLAKALGDAVTTIPDDKTITITHNTPEVTAQLEQLGIKLTTLPDGKVKLTPNTPEAQALIDAFIAKNSTLPPVTVQVDADTTAARTKLQNLYSEIFRAPYTPEPNPPGGPPNPLAFGPDSAGFVPYDPSRPRRATGGEITGPGPQGQDSVLMWGAPGEHMLTGDDVAAMGGQGGVYAFRKALHGSGIPGFKGGGAIENWMRANPNLEVAPSRPDKPWPGPGPVPGRGPGRGEIAGPGSGNAGWPDWSPGTKFGEPPADWWTKPIDPDNILFPEWVPPGMRERQKEIWEKRKPRVKPWKDEGIPGFEGGGAIGAIDYAYNASGKPYQYGTFDCSMYMSQIYARMAGLPPGRYFTTDSDFAALGFQRGFKPGALNIGTTGGSGRNGHMAGTLPNGINVENSGDGSIYGPGASGAQDFSGQWYYEAPAGTDKAPQGTQDVTAPGIPVVAASADAGVPGGTGGRTEGYIPSGAGGGGQAGSSLASGFLSMGAEAINGLIDQAASAASQAAGIASMSGGAGGGGQAAQLAIGLGTQAAKRGVEYGFQMAGIGIDAVTEILSPFGAPRILSTNAAAFIPQFGAQPVAATTPGGEGDTNTTAPGPAAMQPVQPGQMPGVSGPTPAAQPPDSPTGPTPMAPPAEDDWLKRLNAGVFDSGGVLGPKSVGFNLSNQNEHVLTDPQWDAIYKSATAYQTPAPDREMMGGNRTVIENITVKDVAELRRELDDRDMLATMRYRGRPTPG